MAEKSKIKLAWLEGSFLRRQEMLRKIRDRFPDAEHIICRGDMTMEYFMSEVETVSCFGGQRVVFIHEMPIIDPPSAKNKNIAAFKSMLSGLSDDTLVVFNNIDPSKFADIKKYVNDHGKVYFFDPITQNGYKFLIDLFDKQGYKISEENARMIATNYGWDNELEGVSVDVLEIIAKEIILFLGKNKEVKTEDILLTLFQHDEVIVWDLIDALDKKDFGLCQTIFVKASNLGGSASQAAMNLLPALMWRFNLLLFLKEAKQKFADNDKIIKYALQMRKLAPSSTGEFSKMEVTLCQSGENTGNPLPLWNHNVISRAISSFNENKSPLDIYSRKELFRIVQMISDIILTMRRENSDSLAVLLVDVLFIAICNLMVDEDIKKLKNSLTFCY